MNELDMVKAISEFIKRSIDNNPNFSEWENGGENAEWRKLSSLQKNAIGNRTHTYNHATQRRKNKCPLPTRKRMV